MKAKNELLKYLIEANLSKWISNEEKLPFRQKVINLIIIVWNINPEFRSISGKYHWIRRSIRLGRISFKIRNHEIQSKS